MKKQKVHKELAPLTKVFGDHYQPGYIFSDESIKTFKELGEVLRRIRIRMRKEGYDIIDGEIRNVETGEVWKEK